MNTYITQIIVDGIPFAGPPVLAVSWDEAQATCNILYIGVTVIGHLVEIIDLC